MKSMKKATSLLLALAMLFALAACGGKNQPSQQPSAGGDAPKVESGAPASDPSAGSGVVKALSKPVEINFWHCVSNATYAAILEGQIDAFNNGRGAELGIKVVPSLQGSAADLYNAVVGAIKANSAPDVIMASPTHTAEYLQADCIVELSGYVNDPDVGIDDRADFYDNFWAYGNSFQQEGTYSLPFNLKAEVLYYNVKFFEEHDLAIPTIWDEMLETCREIKGITGLPAFGWDNMSSAFATLLLQKGGAYTSPDGEILFLNDQNEALSKEVIQLWKDCMDEGIWRLAGEDKLFSGPFANEIIPMYIGVTTESTWINQKCDEDFVWSAAPIPQYDAANPAAFLEGYTLEIVDQRGDPEKDYACWEFIKYMTSHDANLAIACGSGYMPIRKSVADDPDYAAYIEESGDQAQVVGTAQADAYFVNNAFVTDTYTSNGLWAELKTMMGSVLTNGVEIDTALNQLKTQFQ